ncbi:MAG TPA: hypothetical protein VD887_07930 [Allosphingosinicella sp.]|nr:hypothetical protein [Allosphingosinicella sp.]
MDWDPFPLDWPPRGSLKQWLTALGAVAALLLIFYAIFSALE